MSEHKVSNGELREGYEFRQDALRILGYEGCPSNTEGLDKLRWLKREWEEYKKFNDNMRELLKGDTIDARGILGRVEDLHLYESAGKLFRAKLQDQVLLSGMVVNDNRLLERVAEVMKAYRVNSDEQNNFVIELAHVFGLAPGAVSKPRVLQHAKQLMDIIQDNQPGERRPVVEYLFKSFKDHDDYAGLAAVLLGALEQAAYGKGRERHANDLPFEQQPMNAICDILGGPEGMAYQVTKKVAEALKMPTYEQQERELFGAINYTAGIIIWLQRHNPA